MTAPRLSVVIPSWNGIELLRAHLPSVLRAASAAGGGEIVVSDDGSTDGTSEILARELPDVRVVARRENCGFAHAANAGVSGARGRLVLLLNNDMEIRPDAVARLADALESNDGAFAAVPSIVRVQDGVEEARTRIRFSRGVISTSLDGEPGRDPAYACGGAMIFRRFEFMELGGFDPLFAPFYWEDVDLSYRARKRGRRVLLVPAARVDHDHGSTIGSRFLARHVARIYERNRLIFTWKNLTDPALWTVHRLLLPPKLLWNLAYHPPFVAGYRDARELRTEIRSLRAEERRRSIVRDRELLSSARVPPPVNP